MFFLNHPENRLTKKILTFSTVFISSMAMADSDLNTAQAVPAPEPAYKIKATNSLWEAKDIEPDFYDNPYQISLFSPEHGEDSDRLLSQTSSIFALGIGVVTVLGAMPSSITNWETEKDEPDLPHKWLAHVTSGPVWDRDDWYLNYLAHPYFGGVFYQSARKSGYRQWDAFIYSFMMSSFYWEYGIEAFAETPSIQDLVVTPVLGWVYGEWAFTTERSIRLNGGSVLGSQFIGKTSLFLLDPVDTIGRNINSLFGHDIFKAGTGYFTFQQSPSPKGNGSESQIGLNVSYLFGGGDSEALPAISGRTDKYSSRRAQSIDPVDTGIVGLAAGGTWINLDKKSGLTDAYGRQFSLGLYFTRSISSRLTYSRAEVKERQSERTIRYENYALDMQYYLNPHSAWRPFITAGIGEQMFDRNRDNIHLQINGGLGIHYKINNNWALQSDWRHYYSPATRTNENQLATAVIYRFGKGEWSL